MCGIFLLLNNFYTSMNTKRDEIVYNAFMKGKSRGPETSTLVPFQMNAIAGFHRLAINGLDALSNQPLCIDGINLICNGEIYNYKELYKSLGITPKTNSDCEVIIHLYKKFGIEYTLTLLDGVFAFALQDSRNVDYSIYIARDPYGVRPLYKLRTSNPNTYNKPYKDSYGFASEMKMLIDLKENIFNGRTSHIEQMKPGTYSKLIYPKTVCGEWVYEINEKKYNNLPNIYNYEINTKESEVLLQNVKNALELAVKKRVENTERPIACLLSGGLDSSLITALVNKYYDYEKNGPLKTYTIGLPGSEDFKYAEQVAEFLKTDHTTITMNEDDFFNAIPEVIYNIESYDTTTVRASVGNYLVAKYISENSDAKVIFNGDGADEVMGGYLYFHKCPNEFEFDNECRRLVENIHFFDVQRSDRSISSNGLEPRTPFLDKGFVQSYFSLPANLRFFSNKDGQREKYLIRKMFDDDNLLPKETLWRVKEAFSDGVSSHKRSWYEIINEKVGNEKYDTDLNQHITPVTQEQKYYKSKFDKYFKNCDNVIPHYWMPKYVDATDASARTLDVYNENMSTQKEA